MIQSCAFFLFFLKKKTQNNNNNNNTHTKMSNRRSKRNPSRSTQSDVGGPIATNDSALMILMNERLDKICKQLDSLGARVDQHLTVCEAERYRFFLPTPCIFVFQLCFFFDFWFFFSNKKK